MGRTLTVSILHVLATISTLKVTTTRSMNIEGIGEAMK
jgi:hypothetical protein